MGRILSTMEAILAVEICAISFTVQWCGGEMIIDASVLTGVLEGESRRRKASMIKV